MFEKLKDVAARYEQINEKLMDPTVVSDNNQYKTLMKEHKNLTPIRRKIPGIRKAEASLEEAKELLEEGGLDKDFKEIVEEQMTTSRDEIERLGEELKILLLPKDPNDDKNVIIEIRGGAGGDEAALFANFSVPDVFHVRRDQTLENRDFKRKRNRIGWI